MMRSNGCNVFSLVMRVLGAATIAVMGNATGRALAQCNAYTLTSSTGVAIVPGTTDTGNHVDDGMTAVALPFPVVVYGSSYSAAQVSSNGNLQFTTANSAYNNVCLPDASSGVALMPHWDDLRTDGTGSGIFTSVSGTAPTRVFNIEWRAVYFGTSSALGFEIRLYEDNSRIEFVYGAVPSAGSGATVGIQPATGAALQFECETGGLSQGLMLTFAPNNNPNVLCGGGTATPASVTNCGGQTSTLLTVHVTPATNPPSTGLTARVDLSSIGGSSTQAMYDDGTHGDAAAGDTTFSFLAPIPSTNAPGGRVLNYSLSDAQGRNGSGSITLAVTACPTRGPDVWVSDLIDVTYYGAAGTVSAYAVGTNACNLGDVPVGWYDGTNQHPVIAQNMFRLKNGRFEQLGQSWLKHGFASTNGGSCGSCVQPPGGGSQLGVSCSDAYGSGLNGSQGDLGPRSQVNATTGVYPWPHGTGATGTIGMRLQVLTSDIDPTQNNGALYFVECHYVTADDAQYNNGTLPGTNGLNNSTYRRVTIASTTATPAFAGNSIVRVPPIQAWRDNDASVQISTADYIDQSLGAPGIVGRFWVGSKVTSNGDGTWHYEYAVYNHNADRCGGSFSVPIAAGVAITNVGFHGVFAHSGEPFPNSAANLDNWSGTVMNGSLVWTCPEAYAPPNGDNGNALRWGTMYNFRFDANVPPSATGGAATIGLYKPATAANPAVSISGAAQVPGSLCGSADFNHDGNVGTDADIAAFFSCIAGNCCPTCGSSDFNGDGDFATDGDIEAFFRVLAGGTC
jgi:hypothetical protein